MAQRRIQQLLSTQAMMHDRGGIPMGGCANCVAGCSRCMGKGGIRLGGGILMGGRARPKNARGRKLVEDDEYVKGQYCHQWVKPSARRKFSAKENYWSEDTPEASWGLKAWRGFLEEYMARHGISGADRKQAMHDARLDWHSLSEAQKRGYVDRAPPAKTHKRRH